MAQPSTPAEVRVEPRPPALRARDEDRRQLRRALPPPAPAGPARLRDLQLLEPARARLERGRTRGDPARRRTARVRPQPRGQLVARNRGRFAADGWTTFAFARHPGDQWCSQWHYARKRGWPSALNTPLDAYLARAFADEWPFRPRRHVDLPDWWQTLDYVAVFSDAAFARFLRGFGLGYSPGARVNVGANPGYDHYRRTGEVSDATHERLLASARWARYQQLLAREAQATDPPLGWSRAE